MKAENEKVKDRFNLLKKELSMEYFILLCIHLLKKVNLLLYNL